MVPGNRVLLRGANTPTLAAGWLAVIKAGAIAVATMPLLRAKELTEIVEQGRRSTHALCDARLADELHERGAALTGRLRDVAYFAATDGLEARWRAQAGRVRERRRRPPTTSA